MDFIKTYKSFEPITEKLTSSDFNTVDGLLNDVAKYLTDTLDHKEWMRMNWEEKGDVINNAMSKVSDRHMKDKKLTNLVNKKTDDIIDYFVGSLSESLISEGKGYYIKVSIRDAKKALAILDDLYRKKFDINGSNVYYFKDEDMAYDAKMDLATKDIEIIDTNIEESVNEGKWSNIMKGVRKGSKSGPWTIVSIENGKVVNQESVTIMDAIPARYEGVKKEFPKAKMSIEDNEGLSVYNESVNEAEFKHINKAEHKIKLAIKDVEKKARLKANRGKPIEYEQLSLNKIMLSKVLGREKLGKEHQDAWVKLKKEYELTESLLTEASDMNDPVLVAVRAAKMRHDDMEAWDKANPKKRPLYGKQREKAQDTLWDISLELKDLYAERTNIYSDMDAEAGQKGSDWTDVDANRYGGELNRVEDKIEQLIPKRKQLEIKLAQ